MGTAAMSVAVAHLGMFSSAEPGKVNPTINSPNTSFERLKQIEAGLLNVGYAESGPTSGRPVLLLHGWPYDIYSFVDVAPLLSAKRLSSDRSVYAWLWQHQFSLEQYSS